MTIDDARKSFPGLKNKVYLDAAAVSLPPRQAIDGIHRFLDLALYGDAEDASSLHIAMDALRQEAAGQAAVMLHVAGDTIALIESTTHGLNIAANSIPLERGDSVLIADTEFLQVAIPWMKKQETAGIAVKQVHAGGGGVLTPEDFENAIDARTRVVCVSSVQWCSGFRLDMAALGALCRDRNIWLIVDAVQEMGAMDIDLSARYADFVIAGGHKWLNAPFGCGIMYVSDRVIRELEPPAYGYLALETPEGGWGEYFRTPDITPFRTYRFPATAKKFEIAGTSNYPGAVGLGKSLKLFNDIGMPAVEKQIRTLTDLLHAELQAIGAHVVTKPDPERRSGITIFTFFETPQQDRELLKRALAENIFISMRYTSRVGGIRVSTHFYNTEEDILSLIASLKRHIRQAR